MADARGSSRSHGSDGRRSVERGRAERRCTRPAEPPAGTAAPSELAGRHPSRREARRRRRGRSELDGSWPRAGVPAPPDHRRLRGRRVRLRPGAHRQRPAGRAAAALPALVPGRGRAASRTSRPTGGALVVANHSGTVAGGRADDPARLLDEHPAHRSLRHARRRPGVLALPGDLASSPARAGPPWPATRTPSGCCAAASSSASGPEGFKGIGKPFSERYKLQRFGRGGFVSAALRTGVPIVPVSIVGAEEIYPMRRQHQGAGPAARAALRPDHADVPAGSARSAWCRCPQVDHRVRRADPRPTSYDPRRRRRPDAGLQPHRPGARDDPADALPAAHAAPVASSSDRLAVMDDARSSASVAERRVVTRPASGGRAASGDGGRRPRR